MLTAFIRPFAALYFAIHKLFLRDAALQQPTHYFSQHKMVASNKYSASNREGDITTAIMVPTTNDASLNPADEQEIDLRQMDENDVKSLQQSGK
jgi:hypothetical protein